MSLRIVLADDQIPWGVESKDKLVKGEILTQIGDRLIRKGKDPEKCYDEDYVWFQKLVNYLETKFEAMYIREYEEAERIFASPGDFDVAVVDLSWTGDPSRGDKPRENIGLKLLEKLKKSKKKIPVIAFSQNFEKDRELMSSVLEHGALPLQKHYDETGHQALASAIKYVALQEADTARMKIEPDKLRIGEIANSLTFSQAWKITVAIITILSVVAGVSYQAGIKDIFKTKQEVLNKEIQPTQKMHG